MVYATVARQNSRSNINRIDRNALDPSVLHDTGNLKRRIVGSQRTHQVERRVQTSSDAARGDDAHATQRHLSATGNRLATTRVAHGVATLARDRLAASMLHVRALGLVDLLAALLDDVPTCGEYV
jgi:hypothetical protein